MYAKLTALATVLVAVGTAAAEFSCIKPVNPIPAGPPGACCEELNQSFLLDFLYTGKNCLRATKIAEDDDGKTTYEDCPAGTEEGCCDPLLMKLNHKTNPACVLPV